MFDTGLLHSWLVIFSFISAASLLLVVRMWFRLRSLEKSEQAKTSDLYDQVDQINNRINAMFN